MPYAVIIFHTVNHTGMAINVIRYEINVIPPIFFRSPPYVLTWIISAVAGAAADWMIISSASRGLVLLTCRAKRMATVITGKMINFTKVILNVSQKPGRVFMVEASVAPSIKVADGTVAFPSISIESVIITGINLCTEDRTNSIEIMLTINGGVKSCFHWKSDLFRPVTKYNPIVQKTGFKPRTTRKQYTANCSN